MAEEGTPRRTVEPDSVRALAQRLSRAEKQIVQLSKSANLRNASISGGQGLSVLDESGIVRLLISTEEAAVIAYDTDGDEVARYGLLSHTDVGDYGLEVLASGTWVHVGDESVTWDNVSGKPSTFTPTSHTHAGGDVTSAVANATNAAAATLAQQAEGSQYAFDNTVGGSTFYAVWVGDSAGFKFGRNTSSARYKENIRDFVNDMSDLMLVRPVVYDRKGKWEQVTTDTGQLVEGADPVWVEGAKGEFGLIAEELAEVWPEVVTYFGGKIDGIRYDLIAARLIPTLQGMLLTLRSTRQKVIALEKENLAMKVRLDKIEAKLALETGG